MSGFLEQVGDSLPYKTETIGLPDMASTGKLDMDYSKYNVRYLKVDLDDAGGRAELEKITTKGLLGKDIVIIDRASFTFMNQYFMVLTYLEAVTPEKPRS